jgi:hypothetical protein
MEQLSHYHCEIYRCKPIPINLNHASTMHQPVPQPVINLYHRQVHEPCANLYQSCVKYSSTMTHQYVPTSSTIHLMYVPTHQLLVSTMYPTCTSTKFPHQFHHTNMIYNFVIYLVYMIAYLQTFLNFKQQETSIFIKLFFSLT